MFDDGGISAREEAGFSLVELVVVVLILGILAAIAIPILGGVEDKARSNALTAIAAEAATGASADLSHEQTPRLDADSGYSLAWSGDTEPTQVDQVCVIATRTDTGETAQSGPGCTGP